jgi:hypothetical protein
MARSVARDDTGVCRFQNSTAATVTDGESQTPLNVKLYPDIALGTLRHNQVA